MPGFIFNKVVPSKLGDATLVYNLKQSNAKLREEVEYLQACFLSMQIEMDKLMNAVDKGLLISPQTYINRLEQIKNITPDQAKVMYEKYKFATNTEKWMMDLLKEFDK